MFVCIVQLLTNKHIAHLELFYITNVIGTFFERVNYNRQLHASLSRKALSYKVKSGTMSFTCLIAT